jgi:DNA-binding response OmpR family regulator
LAKRILIVEDDEFLAEIYNREFLSAGYECQIAADGERALSMMKESNYDLILLDIMLPKMDGLTVLEHIRKDSKTAKVPVVILSNLSQDSTVKQGLALGANGYLLKAQYLPQQAVNEVKKFLS